MVILGERFRFDMYRIFRNDLGIVDAISSPTGASLPYNPTTKTFDEEHPLTIALREWETVNGELDLSDALVEFESLEFAKKLKQQEIIEAAKEEQNALVADYAPPEQASWNKKVEQAEAILQSNDLDDAPILAIEAKVFSGAEAIEDVLATTLFLASTILTRSNQLYQASASISGKRARLWNQIESAQSFEEIQQIVWN